MAANTTNPLTSGTAWPGTAVTNPPRGSGNVSSDPSAGVKPAAGAITSGQTNAGTTTDTSSAATWLPQGT